MKSSAPNFAAGQAGVNGVADISGNCAASGHRFPVLGREQSGVLLTEAAGVPVHAVLACGRDAATGVVLAFLRSAAQRCILVTFANPSTAVLVRRSAGFRRSLLSFDLVLPDGIGMCMAIKWLHGLPARRVSFDMTSLGPELFSHAQAESLSVVLAGGAPGVAARARDCIAGAYPGLRIAGVFDGYANPDETTRRIVALSPDILICGMGGVRQEAFLLGVCAAGWHGWGFTCGGFLDQLDGRVNYYPAWIDRANLRWAYRLFREPRRLWRRYLLDYGRFGLMVCSTLVRRL